MHVTAEDIRHLRLEGALSIYTAADIKPLLSAALLGAIALQIDLSAVDEFDSAGLQLLLATGEQARQQGIDLQFQGIGPVIGELLALSGLNSALGDQEAN